MTNLCKSIIGRRCFLGSFTITLCIRNHKIRGNALVHVPPRGVTSQRLHVWESAFQLRAKQQFLQTSKWMSSLKLVSRVFSKRPPRKAVNPETNTLSHACTSTVSSPLTMCIPLALGMTVWRPLHNLLFLDDRSTTATHLLRRQRVIHGNA